MENQQREQLSRVLTGAAISAAFAYLFMTRQGKKLLESAEPWLDEVIHDMQRLRGTAAKVREAVDESRRSFETIAKLGTFSETGGNTGQQAPWTSEAKH